MAKSIKDTAQDNIIAEARRQQKLTPTQRRSAQANYGPSTKVKVDEAGQRAKTADDTEDFINKRLGKGTI